jgi:hypothetical protein
VIFGRSSRSWIHATIRVATFSSLLLSLVLSIMWFIAERGASQFEPAVATLGVMGAVVGIFAEVCHERGEGLDVGESFLKRCCARDEGRPFGAALRGEASNRPLLHWLKTVVVSDVGKGALDVSGRDQEGERKRIAAEVSSKTG